MEPQFRFCTSADGARISYAVYGSGPPLLFAPVFWGSMDSHFTQGEPRAFMDTLAARMTLVTFDRRGTGTSARDVDDLSPAAEAGDIEAVADSAGLRIFTLLTVVDCLAAAAHYATRHEDRIHRVVLWAPHTGVVTRDWIRTIREDWSVARRIWAGLVYPQGPVSRQREFSHAIKKPCRAKRPHGGSRRSVRSTSRRCCPRSRRRRLCWRARSLSPRDNA